MYIRPHTAKSSVARAAAQLTAFLGCALFAPVAARAQQPRPAAPATKPAQAVPTTRALAPAADPYGFTNWLNGTRARYGLGPVGYDPNLTNWAQMNNAQQARRGMGHYVMGPARRQNSAIGNAANIGAMWMASPAHRAALLDPNIRWIGLASWGTYWTFNAL